MILWLPQKMRADDFLPEWHDYQRMEAERAERDCNGVLYRRDLRYPGRYTAFRHLWLAQPQNACKVASEELLTWWQHNGRLTFAEYVYGKGVRNVKINKRARRAASTTAAALRQGRRYPNG